MDPGLRRDDISASYKKHAAIKVAACFHSFISNALVVELLTTTQIVLLPAYGDDNTERIQPSNRSVRVAHEDCELNAATKLALHRLAVIRRGI